MIVFFLLLVILLIGLTAAAVMGRIGGFMADPTSSQAFIGPPAGPLSADYVGQVHFDQALRGYRMEQVDVVIDALIARLRELEAQATPRREVDAETGLVRSPDAVGSAVSDPSDTEVEGD